MVIPTYNEKENIGALVESIEKTGLQGVEVLFVDDSSPDGTGEEIMRLSQTRPWLRLKVREKKMGIGSAYQDGFRDAIQSRPDAVVEMDADLQHPASFLGELTRAIRDGADLALGSRYIAGGGISGWSRTRRVVSKGANSYARFALGLKVKDATSGYRAYSMETARKVADAKLPAKGFEFQVASLRLLRDDPKVVEVPYVFVPRSAGRSKLKFADIVRFFFGVTRLALS